MNVSVKVDVKELKEYMKHKQSLVSKQLPEVVQKATLYLHGEVKKSIAHGTNAPVAVDTGRFLNSVDFANVGENESKVFTDIEYARYIEFGTSRMNSRPHFMNTMKKEDDNLKEFFTLMIKDVCKE